jgi:hypothetical protein
MEAASPPKAKRVATGGREAKAKAVKKVLSKEEKGVEATKLGPEVKLAVDLGRVWFTFPRSRAPKQRTFLAQ